MTTVLDQKPRAATPATGIDGQKALAKALGGTLADTYRLMFKTHAYHWNVTGPLFYSLHKLTETQYEDLFAAADELAERIRALGQTTVMRFGDIAEGSVLSDLDRAPSAGDMVEDLRADHEKVATRMHELASLAEKHDDIVTADLATQRSSFHEKAAWMLRAIVSG